VTGSLDFLQQRSKIESYDQSRFANQASAFDAMTAHVFGYGPGQAEVNLPLSTHSTYARVAYEQGVLGVALLVLLLVATLAIAVRLAASAPVVFSVGTAALLGSWLGVIFNSAFIDTLHWRHLWLLAGIIWGAYVTRRPTAPPEPTSSLPSVETPAGGARRLRA
jgi:O-antigen ligase